MICKELPLHTMRGTTLHLGEKHLELAPYISIKVKKVGDHETVEGERKYPIYEIHGFSIKKETPEELKKQLLEHKERLCEELKGKQFLVKQMRGKEQGGLEFGQEHIVTREIQKDQPQQDQVLTKVPRLLATDKTGRDLWIEYIPEIVDPKQFQFQNLEEIQQYLKQITNRFALMAKRGIIWHEAGLRRHHPLRRENKQIQAYTVDMGQAFYPEKIHPDGLKTPKKDYERAYTLQIIRLIGQLEQAEKIQWENMIPTRQEIQKQAVQYLKQAFETHFPEDQTQDAPKE